MEKVFLRKLCLLALDMFAVLATGLVITGLYIYSHDIALSMQWVWCIVSLCCVYLVGLLISRLYSTLWRYASSTEFLYCIAVTMGIGLVYVVLSMLCFAYMPLVFYLLIAVCIAVETVLIRLCYRSLRTVRTYYTKQQETKEQKRTLVVGAGASAHFLLRDMNQNPQNIYHPVCVVDDDPAKIGRTFHSIYIAGSIDDIPALCEERKIEAILVCIPSATAAQQKRIYEKCMETKCKTFIIPDMITLIHENKPLLRQVREINIEDLLGRKSVSLDNAAAGKTFTGKTIMVTGAGGSIGSELVRQLAKLQPEKLILLDIYENSVYAVEQELKFQYGSDLSAVVEIASIRDKDKLDMLFQKYRPQIVFHAAAHKHVPLMENNPEEAIKNNIFGTKNLAELSIQYQVERFLFISTDKAVNPTNVMGATKRFCEMMIQRMNERGITRFVAVRFGNVIGSNGSVIPLFQEQLAKGGPLTVTHKDIIRYFMTIPEAVQLVLEAGSMAKGGEIFILDMGEPVRILDVAEKMIRLAGMEPYKDIEIQFIGLRPGEKLYEELCMSEEGMIDTANHKIHIATIQAEPEDVLQQSMMTLKTAIDCGDEEQMILTLQKAVPTYHPQMEYHAAKDSHDAMAV